MINKMDMLSHTCKKSAVASQVTSRHVLRLQEKPLYFGSTL